MFNGMATKRMSQYKEKYLISEGSSLEYYKYSNETQFKIEFEHTANLQSLRVNKKEDSIKLENEKKNYSKMFDSDSDSD
jgi:hypothetical protein